MLTSRQRNLSFRYSDLVSVWGPGLVGMAGAAVKGWVMHDASESPHEERVHVHVSVPRPHLFGWISVASARCYKATALEVTLFCLLGICLMTHTDRRCSASSGGPENCRDPRLSLPAAVYLKSGFTRESMFTAEHENKREMQNSILVQLNTKENLRLFV